MLTPLAAKFQQKDWYDTYLGCACTFGGLLDSECGGSE